MSDEAKGGAEELKELGNQAFAAKDFSKAVDLYSQAIQKDPKNHVFVSNRSASYGGLEQWDKARDDAKECIRLDPSFVKGYYRLASAQMALQDHDGALATIRQGLTVEPNNPQLTKQMKIVQQQKKLMHAKAQTPTSANSSSLMAAGLDAATAQELQELQQQYGQTNRELQMVQANRTKAEREYRMTQLTRHEMQEVPESAACYRSCGKMFLQSKQPELLQHLDQRLETQTKAQHDATKQMEYLERKLLSQRQNIEELVGNAGGGLVAAN